MVVVFTTAVWFLILYMKVPFVVSYAKVDEITEILFTILHIKHLFHATNMNPEY